MQTGRKRKSFLWGWQALLGKQPLDTSARKLAYRTCDLLRQGPFLIARLQLS